MKSSNRSPLSDELIIEKLKSNDLAERNEGWVALDAQYRQKIQWQFERWLPADAKEDARDYTTITILRAVQSIEKYKKKEGTKFFSWVVGIARKVFKEKATMHGKRTNLAELAIHHLKKADINTLELSLSFFKIHPDNVESLSADERAVLKMFYFQDLSYEDIQQQIGKSYASVRKIHSRGLKTIRAVAEKYRSDFGYALLPLFVLRYKLQIQTQYLKFGQLPKNSMAEEMANTLATLRQKAGLTYEEIASRTQLLEPDHVIALEHRLIFDEDIEPDWVNELADALSVEPSKLVSSISEDKNGTIKSDQSFIARVLTYKWYGIASFILTVVGILLLAYGLRETPTVEADAVISEPIKPTSTPTQELPQAIVEISTPTAMSQLPATPFIYSSSISSPITLPTVNITPTAPRCQINPPTAWVNYFIRTGDTVWSLAEQTKTANQSTNTAVSLIQQVNCIEDIRRIIVGQTIWLPTQPVFVDFSFEDSILHWQVEGIREAYIHPTDARHLELPITGPSGSLDIACTSGWNTKNDFTLRTILPTGEEMETSISFPRYLFFPNSTGEIIFTPDDDQDYPKNVFSIVPGNQSNNHLLFAESLPGDYAISPDLINLAINDSGLKIRNLTGTEQIPLSKQYGGQIIWSPDSSHIAFVSMSILDTSPYPPEAIFVVDAKGETEPRELIVGSSPTWSPDGTRLAFISGDTIYTMKPDGTCIEPVSIDLDASLSRLAWSPDGSMFAITVWNNANREGQLYTANTDGSNTLLLVKSTVSDFIAPSWAPNGRQLAFVTRIDGNYLTPSKVSIVNTDGTEGYLELVNGYNPYWISRD